MDEARKCPRCRTEAAPEEKFCGGCGTALAGPGSAPPVRPSFAERMARVDQQSYKTKIQSGRTIILILAILLTLAIPLIYFALRSASDKDELSDSRESILILVTGAYAVLALSYYALWVWAKWKPLPATLTALILFLTVQGIGAAVDWTSLLQGLVIQIPILIGLVRAVSAAVKYDRLKRAGL